MKNLKLPFLGLLAIATSVAAAPAFAQNAPQPIAAPDAAQWQTFQLKNVTPKLMALWLDARHSSVTTGFQGVKPTWAIGKTDAEVKAMLSLPNGVQTLVAIEPQNALRVFGTPAAQQQMAQRIALLDEPVLQVEVEAKIVAISAADAKNLGTNFAASGTASPIEIGTAVADIDEQIAVLKAQNKAKVITAPRVTAIYGVNASLISTTTATTLVTIKTENGDLKVRNWTQQDRLEDQIGLPISTTIQLSVTPTFNPDGTISLAVGPFRTVGISGMAVGQPAVGQHAEGQAAGFFDETRPRAVLKDPDNIPTRPITVKDGQTVILQGMNWGNDVFASSKTPPLNVIVLLTARRLRRAGDTDAIPVALTR